MLAASAQEQPAGRKRENAPGQAAVPALNLKEVPQMPRLSVAPTDSLLQFLVCEMDQDPRQVRVKASAWRPKNSSPRKAVNRDGESEPDDEDEDAARQAEDDDDDHSEAD